MGSTTSDMAGDDDWLGMWRSLGEETKKEAETIVALEKWNVFKFIFTTRAEIGPMMVDVQQWRIVLHYFSA